MCARLHLLLGFITRAIRKANADPAEKATVASQDAQMEHARAFAELMSCSVKQMGKDKEEEKGHVEQGEASKLITLAALPNDCR